MQWEATDQFGNLYVLASQSKDVKSLRGELTSMIEQLRDRYGDEFVLTIDFAYSEINGPDAENVSHVLQVSWLTDCDDHTSMLLETQDLVADICGKLGCPVPEVLSA